MGLGWTPSEAKAWSGGLPSVLYAPLTPPPPAGPVIDPPTPIQNPINPDFGPVNNMQDLAKETFSSYYGSYWGTPQKDNRGKIAIYQATTADGSPMYDANGRPIYVINVTGTEASYVENSNIRANWGAAGSGYETDYEREVLLAIQDAVAQGKIPPNATLDLTGHSLGGITVNNISGRYDGVIPTAQGNLPIRNVLGFGTPRPAIWSDKVNYVEVNTSTDPVGNIPTYRFTAQWRDNPNGPANLTRITSDSPSNSSNGFGHGGYVDGNPGNNSLFNTPPPPGMNYGGLHLVSAYDNPVQGTPMFVPQFVKDATDWVLGKLGIQPASQAEHSDYYGSGLAVYEVLEGPQLLQDYHDIKANVANFADDASQAGNSALDTAGDLWQAGQGDPTAVINAVVDGARTVESVIDAGEDAYQVGQSLWDAGKVIVDDLKTGKSLVEDVIAPIVVAYVEEKAREYLNKGIDWVESQANRAYQAGQEIAQKAQDLWNQGVNWVETKAEQAYDKAVEWKDQAGKWIETGVNRAESEATEIGNTVEKKAEDLWDAGKDAYNGVKKFFGF